MPHIPYLTVDGEELLTPDTAEGAYVGCDCEDCREARLADPDRIYYSAHEMADAWKAGWDQGCEAAVRRIYRSLKEWLEEVE
jgi:hypothetical protein